MAKIAVVDDDQTIRELIAAVLQDEGFEIATYARAEPALAQLALDHPDLLILDGRLPDLSGWTCLNRLRQTGGTARVPVVLLTAALDDLAAASDTPDPYTTYLAKPFDLEDCSMQSTQHCLPTGRSP